MSLTKTLTDSIAFETKYVNKGWGFTCEALLKLLENPPILAAADDVIVDQDVDDMSFGVGFTQLTTIRRPARDQWPEITDVKRWVGEYLKAANTRKNGKMRVYAGERLSPAAQTALRSYMSN